MHAQWIKSLGRWQSIWVLDSHVGFSNLSGCVLLGLTLSLLGGVYEHRAHLMKVLNLCHSAHTLHKAISQKIVTSSKGRFLSPS